jgi:hypothetical protein
MANRNRGICPCEVCRDHPRSAEAISHRKLNQLVATLDEKAARQVVGLLADREGHGGTAKYSRLTGMSRTTILAGRRELGVEDVVPIGRVRRVGGGRKPLEKKDRT